MLHLVLWTKCSAVGMDGCVSATGKLFVSVPRGNNVRLCFAVTIISGAWRANLVIWDPGQISSKQNLLAKDEKLGFHASFYILFSARLFAFWFGSIFVGDIFIGINTHRLRKWILHFAPAKNCTSEGTRCYLWSLDDCCSNFVSKQFWAVKRFDVFTDDERAH